MNTIHDIVVRLGKEIEPEMTDQEMKAFESRIKCFIEKNGGRTEMISILEDTVPDHEIRYERKKGIKKP